ncbi:hypothetical protein HP439_17570 [Sphingobacterium shayense]|uniref:TRAFAC clade GTPase domain-containing protein n=1 Tax=Sphingobacterium shayense TaxID=626343 RepID=UPI001555F60F|nr:hypothetical protein [Sphingobacterium shayense]NQD72536.1 hypothetical protein [Sphingobacterium shayense]
MEEKSILLVGGPDSGKSNYLARFWLALQGGHRDLLSSVTPSDVRYVESIAEHILQAEFAPRTDLEEKNREFRISVKTRDGSISADIVVPDILGEVWSKAVASLNIPEKWLKTLRSSSAAVLFVRVHSEINTQPLNWITSQEFLKNGLGGKQVNNLPTQIVLMELLRFIDENINRSSKAKPKVAVIVTAWDLLSKGEAKLGPLNYLKNEFPMFEGRISDIDSLNVKVFGCSIVGGDFQVASFQKDFLDKEIDETGYIMEEGADTEKPDITAPIGWLLHED